MNYKEYCEECRCVIGGDPYYFGDDGPLCEGCHDNLKARYVDKWPKPKPATKEKEDEV